MYFSQHYNLIYLLLHRDIASRYRGSVLGLVWSFIHPLMMLAVYTFVFGVVFRARWGAELFEDAPAAFPLIMLCGMAVYNLFSESLNSSAALIVRNTGLVKKVIFPLELLPLCAVGTTFFFGIPWFVLLAVGAALLLDGLHWTALLLPLTLVPVFLLSAGTAFAAAAFGVYLRDVPQIAGVFTQILFFLTPVIYPIGMVPEGLRPLLYCNPLTPMVEETRKILLYGQWPDPGACLLIWCVGLVVFLLGFTCFRKLKKGFADVL